MAQRFLLLALVASASAQFGRKNNQQQHAAGSLGDMGGVADNGVNDVDLAMQGWEQLGKNPEKMQELMQGFKDPDVWAKAQEMLKDPQYMAAAQAKLAEIQAKAQANGMLDAHGNPVPGAASAGSGGLDGMMAAMKGMGAAAGATAPQGQARDWELDNIEKHKAGEMNAAELGMANLKNAMKDPSVLGEVAQMMKDPENMAALKKMMSDPTFQAQAKRMQEQMAASGELPDFSKMAQMMGGAAGGGMGGGGAAAELERLRRENAQLK